MDALIGPMFMGPLFMGALIPVAAARTNGKE